MITLQGPLYQFQSSKIQCGLFHPNHSKNCSSEMVEGKHFSDRKDTYLSVLKGKSRRGKIFEFPHYPFELPTNQHCCLTNQAEFYGACYFSPKQIFQEFKIFTSTAFGNQSRLKQILLKTYFAYAIFEPKFTVCLGQLFQLHPIYFNCFDSQFQVHTTVHF